ncbi:AAA family ATPase [Patescibacteria group bacterium]|nr:AAA family ATPase [Patescibacteria group bacterium]
MKQQFPIFKTKIKGVSRSFNLSNPKNCKEYFKLKAGPEIKKIRDYLKKNTFIAYFLGKKGSGKGTYSKLFIETVAPQRVSHVSIGDIIRDVHQEISNENKKRELINWLSKNYRGYISIDQAIQALLSRSTETLLPTELILALVKRKISKIGRKALFIDGFPRGLDQISYSLFFRDLIDYREDPDIFVLINAPEAVIDERIKHRVVCPLCQTPGNLKLCPTEEVVYDKKQGKFYLICHNPDCKGRKMVSKEGDELGIEPIRDRLEMDEKLIRQAFSLYGIPKILLRNSVPIKLAKDFVDDYEITPEYSYQWDEKKKKVKIIEKPWIVLDDKGVRSFSLLPQAMAVSLIKQTVDILNL